MLFKVSELRSYFGRVKDVTLGLRRGYSISYSTRFNSLLSSTVCTSLWQSFRCCSSTAIIPIALTSQAAGVFVLLTN